MKLVMLTIGTRGEVQQLHQGRYRMHPVTLPSFSRYNISFSNIRHKAHQQAGQKSVEGRYTQRRRVNQKTGHLWMPAGQIERQKCAH